MKRCTIKTIKGTKCQRNAMHNGLLCKQHYMIIKIKGISEEARIEFWRSNIFPREIWKEIAKNLDLPDLCCLYQTCLTFYGMFANDDYFAQNPWYVVLKESSADLDIIPGTESENQEINKYRTNVGSKRFIYDNKTLPFKKPIGCLLSGNPIIHTVNSYKYLYRKHFRLLMSVPVSRSENLYTTFKNLAKNVTIDEEVKEIVQFSNSSETIDEQSLIPLVSREKLEKFFRKLIDKVKPLNLNIKYILTDRTFVKIKTQNNLLILE